jgi:UDP-2,3-diacylglucosamine hydrolase
MSSPDRALFVSDLHLGTAYSGARADREALFEKFLLGLEGNASRLYLLGDVFEFWMEYRHYISKHHFGVLAALYRLRKSGMEIHYIGGNHDFNLGSFFEDSLGIVTHDDPFEANIQGKRLLLLHGDGMNPTDWKYRIVRRILRHPLSNWAWKLLHPDWGMNIALGVGKASRDQNHGTISDEKAAGYESEARALLKQGYDIVMHGHIHRGFVKTLPEGVYVNTGEWVKRLEYVEMLGGECSLRTYDPSVTGSTALS